MMTTMAAAGASTATFPTRQVESGRLGVGSAAELAHLYDLSVEAYWRGELDDVGFGAWLEAYWQSIVSAGPESPDAVSIYGAGGRGLVWRNADGAIIAQAPGVLGGYRIPIEARPPR
jgi:hypothetical protein